MTIQKILDFNKRCNVPQDTGANFDKFKNRVLIALDSSVGIIILRNKEIEGKFAFLSGIEAWPNTVLRPANSRIRPTSKYFRDTLVYKEFASSDNLTRLAEMLQALFSALEEDPDYSKYTDDLFIQIQQAIEISPNINISISKSENSVILYPSGAKLLDEGVINENLSWLADYPTVAKPFEEALRIYLTKDKNKYRNLLDNLRVALEQLLCEILRNKKSFENQKDLLLSWLNGKGAHSQVVNLYNTLVFGPYRIYQNEAVKHGEKFSPVEIEFMIYLTGTFMRLLIQLKRSNP